MKTALSHMRESGKVENHAVFAFLGPNLRKRDLPASVATGSCEPQDADTDQAHMLPASLLAAAFAIAQREGKMPIPPPKEHDTP